MNVEKQFCVKNNFYMDDVPDFDFGEDECSAKDEKELNFNGQEMLKKKETLLEPKKFTQTPICLTTDCKKNVDSAIHYLSFITKSDGVFLQIINYFEKTSQMLDELHQHYVKRQDRLRRLTDLIREWDGKLSKFLISKEAEIKEIKREIVKLSFTQIEQGYLLLNQIEARQRDFLVFVAILAECELIFSKKCDCCVVTEMPQEREEILKFLNKHTLFATCLQKHRDVITERLKLMEYLANESLAAATECLDRIYVIQMSEPST